MPPPSLPPVIPSINLVYFETLESPENSPKLLSTEPGVTSDVPPLVNVKVIP